MKKKVYYEQPLNDRMKNLLRIEHLLTGMMYYLTGPSEWDTRAVIKELVEILDLLERNDYLTDLVKDLEQHTQTLDHWQRTPEVDTERLTQLLTRTTTLISQLRDLQQHQSINNLANHYLINLLRQRLTIIGGTSRGDLPGYFHWLQKNPKHRQNELNEWLTPLEPLREALEMDLYLIRNNAITTQETAITGHFQTKLDANNATYQLIQVALPLEQPYYPEINGGKQRFTIRFLKQPQVDQRPMPYEQDVNFELSCCML